MADTNHTLQQSSCNGETININMNATSRSNENDNNSMLSSSKTDRQREKANDSSIESPEEQWCHINAPDLPTTSTMIATTFRNKPKQNSKDDDDDDDDDNERDRFSPIGFSLNLHENNELAGGSDNNGRLNRRGPNIASKEEKQRQNEEIVIMESSSISSETGSWESVFPQRDGGDNNNNSSPKDLTKQFLCNEHKNQIVATTSHEVGEEVAEDRFQQTENDKTPVISPVVIQPRSTANISACFIDASTLLDDGEAEYISSMTASPIPTRKNVPTIHENTLNQCENGDKNTELNLSDEEKLNTKKSHEIEPITNFDIRDQYSSDSSSTKDANRPISIHMTIADAPTPPPSARERDRSDHERKQGNFLFQNSIQQFSGHAINPRTYTDDSDFSLPSVYSGSSDPYNDCGSVFDTSSHHSSNYGDRDSHDYSDLHQFSANGSKNDSIIYPDTPHNSILQVNAFPQRISIAPSDSAIASLSSSESNSGIPIPKPRTRRDEDSVPIVSGGASIKDFTPKQCDSPSVHRRSEESPIITLSGMTPTDFQPKPRPRTIEKHDSSACNSWVVDMSDCGKKNRRGSESSSTSTEFSGRITTNSCERSNSGSSNKALGFYVSLNDMKPPRLGDESISKSLNYQTSSAGSRKKSLGFFVDLSNSSSNATNTPPPTANVESQSRNDDKKNIFSMFIDFGNDKAVRRDSPTRISASLPRDGSYDSPVAMRRIKNVSSTLIEDESKRHSWNTSKPGSTTAANLIEHKHSDSTSSENSIMNILDKIPLISKTSSLSIDTPNSPYDDITSSKSISNFSNNSLTSLSVHSNKSMEGEADKSKRHQKDVKIGETFDKSSQGSLTDGILSKNSSPTSNTETDDVTFQNENDETIQNGASQIMETIPESETVVLRRSQHTMESLQATIEKQKQMLNTVAEEPLSFVKLSDMDKPSPKFEMQNAPTRPKSVGSRIGKMFDQNKIGNRNTWHHMSKSTGNNLTNLASSVENLRSLTRIFPHLGKDLSNSLPTNFEHDFGNLSPMDLEIFQSDFSTSSATSSISRSGMDSADEFSLSSRQPRRLGEDLLKMFLQEVATDVIIEVNGRKMRAHKCILRSRCQYFAAILAGGWVESAGNVISLSGYSYSSVHFALCHIYSGAAHPPEGISLMELAALADLLGLEGLKEVASYSLKTNYCHSFHKPCSGCIDGVTQVFPVALNQGLDDLYRKCLRWSCKHFLKVWPSRSFSQLPSELIMRCKQHIIAHMTSETVIQTLLDCDKLLALLAPCRWAINIENCVRDIIEAGHDYITDHFASIIASDGFLALGQGQSWNISRLENMLLRSGSSLTPDQACRSYQRITRLNSVLHAKINKMHTSRIDKNIFNSDYGNDHDDDDQDEDELDWSDEFIRLVNEVHSAVEQCLVRQCSRAMKSNQWQRMDEALRKKIQKIACLSDPIERRSRSGPRPVTYSSSIIHSNRSQDLHQVKMVMQAHSKRSHEIQSSKPIQKPERSSHQNDKPAIKAAAVNKLAKTNSRAQVPDLILTIKSALPPKSQVPIRSASSAAVHSNHRRSASDTTNHLKKNASSASVDVVLKKPFLRDIKPRYLEPKRSISTKDSTQHIQNRSSSGSSRTSSPCVSSTRHKDGMLQGGKKALSDITMSRDSLASPAKKSDKLSKKDTSQEHQERLSVDSLGGSMQSSVITNQTNSQESLAQNKAKINNPSKQVIETGKPQHRPNPTLKSNNVSSVNSSTPSSIVTLKSRLSTNSSISSPRDSAKSRLTTPANSNPLIPITKSSSKSSVKSFLSARSRQILAQKKALSHSDSSKSIPTVLKEKSFEVHHVNKSSSTSNVTVNSVQQRKLRKSTTQTATTAPAPTKTQITVQHSLMNPTKSSALKMVTQNNKTNRDTKKKSTNNNENCSSNDDDVNIPIKIESKLERSSTFCKERSELPNTELQIID